MTEVVSISLENEMDLVLAHKRSMKVAEKLGLTVATQTTFATAVSEVARAVIEYTDNGTLTIGIEQNKTRYALKANVTFNSEIKLIAGDEGFYYAQKLVPEFELSGENGAYVIDMKLGLPRSLKLDAVKISILKKYFHEEQPLNPYEEIKRRNSHLHKLTAEQEEELKRTKLIDEKKTEFISIASHELKTPLTVLKAFTQMAKSTKEPVSDRLKGLLNKIDLQSNKLNSLVQQLLDISRAENGNLQYNMQQVKLNSFIVDQLAVMQSILPNHIISSSLGDDADVMIDILRMEQVFSNLLGNAAKYSRTNTSVEVSSAFNSDGHITISIKDQGIGMSADTMTSIFDKFYRAEDVSKTHAGLGMGLYITSKIVTDHGGKIWVDSKENEGSTFHFSLPNCEVA
ncbi:Signal transduction histidine kinase [Mucilaginibacter gossypiicola]|uniref:histidine kinase n=1 Tax=Mucilaginibacter gossypiicola TaxID=551995 RepID=A0A1H8B4V3_9SPHI|nr:sensor histidine kinase [Mucilaginibacter gossypiicola]SEM77776.1 Signal transduction histidine kinase [Mucilaginibacter gossypiicola]